MASYATQFRQERLLVLSHVSAGLTPEAKLQKLHF